MHDGLRKATPSRRGSALVFVSLFVLAVSALSLSFVSVLNSSRQEARGSRESLDALYVCEAGVSAALADLATGGDGNVGAKDQPVSLGAANYWVAATDIGQGRTSLVASGGDGRTTMRAEVVVRRSSSTLYRCAAFADEELNMDSNAMTDSFDSSVDTYANQAVNGSGSDVYANENGGVGSNVDVSMSSNTVVYGNAHPGPSGAATLSGSAQVTGVVLPASSDVSFPPIEVPAIPQTGSRTVSSDETLPSGDYHFTKLVVNGNETLTVEGPARIVCDDFLLSSNADLRVDARNGDVEFYVKNDFLMNSNTSITSLDYKPSQLQFYLLSDNIIDPDVDVDLDADEVVFNSNAWMYGTIYAPNAQVEIDSNFQLYGSLVARRVDLDSNSKIHYDESLARGGSTTSSSWETLCWRILSRD